MQKINSFTSLLVPTDFSENSWLAFQQAKDLVSGDDAEIVVVHAIDPAFLQQAVQLGLGDHESILKSAHASATERMLRYSQQKDDRVQVDTIVCDGEPFLEIIRKARDFAVDAIVMSKAGERTQANSLLFGTTAEKVIRGSNKPVLVLPTE